MSKEFKTIYVQETFGPLVGTRTVSYTGYFVSDTEFIAKRNDGTLMLRELCPHGSRLVKFVEENAL